MLFFGKVTFSTWVILEMWVVQYMPYGPSIVEFLLEWGINFSQSTMQNDQCFNGNLIVIKQSVEWKRVKTV